MIIHNAAVTGSLIINGTDVSSITGSSTYSASFASQIASLNDATASLNTYTSSNNTNISALNAQSASFLAYTSSNDANITSLNTFSSSILSYTSSANTKFAGLDVASGSAITRLSSLEARTGSYAITGSNIFIGTQTISGSILQSGDFTSTGIITAQTLNVQQVTSSIVFSSGSNIFGNSLSNTQVMTGSLQVSGSTHSLFGNVGIGTASPGQLLSLSSDSSTGTAVNIINTSSGGYNWNIFSVGSAATLAPVGSLVFRDSINGLSRMTISTGGNVGIGTTSPAAILQTQQTSSGNRVTGALLQNVASAANTAVSLDFAPHENASTPTVLARIDAIRTATSNAPTDLVFSTFNASLQERMRISSGGSINFNGTDATTQYNFGQNRPDATNLLVNGTNNNKIRIQNAETDIVVINSNGASYFNGGNVGIGTTSPAEKLHVLGNIQLGSNTNQFIKFRTLSAWDYSIEGNNDDLIIKDNPGTEYIKLFYNGGGSSKYTSILGNLNVFAGNVGIGTASPDILLTVDGKTPEVSTINLARFYASKGQSDAAYLQIQGTRHPTSSVQRIALDAFNGAGSNVSLILQQGGGNVGIGTTSPSGKLHVAGDGDAANLIRLQHTGTGSNGFFDLNVNSTEAALVANYSTTAIPMLFLTGATERMRITSGGNVGIGTTSPARALEVYSSNTNQTAQVIVSSGTNIKAYLGTFSNSLYLTAGGTFNGGWSTDGSNAVGAIVIGAANNDSSIAFQTNNTNGAPQNRMFINNAGNVGIGTTSPAFKLDMTEAGTVISGTATIGSNMKGLRIYNSVTDVTNNAIGLWFSTGPHQAGIASFRATADTTWETTLAFYTHVDATSNLNDATEKMRITGEGSVLLQSNNVLGLNTSDGSDNGYLAIAGAGADGATRGGHIYLSGNERSADAGSVVIATGNTTSGTGATAATVFRNAGSERMRITSAGNVGIGTDTITNSRLQINTPASSTNEVGLRLRNSISNTSASVALYFQAGYTNDLEAASAITGYRDGNGNAGFLTLSTSTGAALSERMRITSAGNVGINITSPNTTLHVNGTTLSSIFTGAYQYHGIKVLVLDIATSFNINLVTEFPQVSLTTGNSWGVTGKINTLRGGASETLMFSISRDSSGNWGTGVIDLSSNSGGTTISSITGSGSTLTINAVSSAYVTVEITVMVR